MSLKYQLESATVKNYRSISELTVDFSPGKITVIAGPNNVGKTNFLRALDLFFSLDVEKFDQEVDVPYHIVRGSRGRGTRTIVTAYFREMDTDKKCTITAEFKERDDQKQMTLFGLRERQKLSHEECAEIIGSFRFVFVESSNVDLPRLISEVFVDDVLPSLDKLKAKQDRPLELLAEFQQKSEVAVKSIEKSITTQVKGFVERVRGIEAQDWYVKIMFPNFKTLREAIANQVSLTLNDNNDQPLETKGSGIQRVILLSVMKHVATSVKSVTWIWGIDEPEVFLQPGLQKSVFQELRDLAAALPVMITTHSPNFIDVGDLNTTYLFEARRRTKTFVRRKKKVFMIPDTRVLTGTDIEKLSAIKDHFGIESNDSWHVLPSNLIVEGEADRTYLTSLATRLGVHLPNMFVAHGATKYPGYLAFLGDFCKGLQPKPNIVCLLDYDSAGKETARKLQAKSAKPNAYSLEVKFICRYDGKTGKNLDFEVEDWIYPEVIRRAVNLMLRELKYKTIGPKAMSLRNSPSNISSNMLTFLTETVAQRNPDKDRIDFNTEWVKMKLSIFGAATIKTASVEELDAWDEEYPHTRALLTGLVGGSAEAEAAASLEG